MCVNVCGCVQIEAGWTMGPMYDEEKKEHPHLTGLKMLSNKVSRVHHHTTTLPNYQCFIET